MGFISMLLLYLLLCWIFPDKPRGSCGGNDVFIPFEEHRQHQNHKDEFEDKEEYHRYEHDDFGEFGDF